MDESAKENQGKGESQELEAVKLTNEPPISEAPTATSTSATAAKENAACGDQPTSESTLPVAWSPRIDADGVNTEEVLHSKADASGQGPKDEVAGSANASGASTPRLLRLALASASIAAAAAIGSFIGSLSATGMEHLWPTMAMNAAGARKDPAPRTKTESAEVSALKANLEAATRAAGGELAKLSERLDRFERTQADPAAKLARIADAVEQLENKAPVPASLPAMPAETTGSIARAGTAASEPKSSEKVLRDWIVREAHGGRALVENRSGGVFEVTNGSLLPGLGQVESVKRQDGQWIVLTAHGVIYSAP